MENSPPSGKAPAFRALVEEHKEHVYRLARDLTGNHHDAEDLSQEVFIKAYRALDDFRGEAKLSTWLYRITVNTYLNEKRKKSVQSMQFRDNLRDHQSDGESLPRPDQRVREHRLQQHIEEALEALSPRERTAFVLRQYQGLSTKETAAAMDVATGTVKSLLYRGLQKLRSELKMRRDDLNKLSG